MVVMPSVYYLANGELPVVQAFLNLSQLPLDQKREQPQKEDMQEIVSSLLKKEYLSMNPEGRYRLDESLAFILTAAGNAHGVFKMQRSGGKNCVLAFVNDILSNLNRLALSISLVLSDGTFASDTLIGK